MTANDNLIRTLERDIRNKVILDRMLRLDWKGRLRVHIGYWWSTYVLTLMFAIICALPLIPA